MRILRLWIAIAVFSVLFSVAAAQDRSTQQVTPIEVPTLDCKSPKQLLPGDKYCLQLKLDSNNYDAGIIDATFTQVEGPPSGTRYSGPLPRDSVVANDHLLKCRTIYTLRFDVTEDLAPGKWKLTKVVVGQSKPEEFKISKDVTFEILAPSPIVVHAHSPQSVEAGETYRVTVTVDDWTKNLYKGCVLSIGIRLKAASPDAQLFGLEDQALTADKRSYTFSLPLASDFPGGSFSGEVVESGGNDNDHSTGCRYPELKGDTKFDFKIEANKNFKPPTSVEVIVNPSQIQLLRGEIDLLNAKAHNLKEQLRSKSPADRQALLRVSLDEATTELASTERQYKKQETNPANVPVASVFFGDLKRTYDDAQKALADKFVRVTQTEPRLIYASTIEGDPSPHMDASEAVVKSIERNISAYQFAVSNQSLFFNLEVRSEPEQGADISYRRGRGKPFRPWHTRTDTTLQSLERAFYTIRVQKSGYGDQCVDFDAMADGTTTITIPLKHEDGCKQ